MTFTVQVERLTKQYEEIAALAAAAGLQLEDPLTSSSPPAAAAAKEKEAAAAKGPQPKAVEIAEGDRKVRAGYGLVGFLCSLFKGFVFPLSFLGYG
jgi:hypothetical protein